MQYRLWAGGSARTANVFPIPQIALYDGCTSIDRRAMSSLETVEYKNLMANVQQLPRHDRADVSAAARNKDSLHLATSLPHWAGRRFNSAEAARRDSHAQNSTTTTTPANDTIESMW